ncbi:MAG: type II toxin-antitoxin system PemK/MazF family toxin [Spirochaetia bacterium]|jgi:mRNA interferase MazF|nr:type II toxin-antitoxin system PemK/MazF family toxin [Spirochaetia bacterium]
MGSFAVGDVVLVRFPFSDLSGSKLRPVVVLANSGRGDWVLCQVTSKAYADASAIFVPAESYSSGTLDKDSYIRPGKLFTANESIIVKKIAVLKVPKTKELQNSVMRLLFPES